MCPLRQHADCHYGGYFFSVVFYNKRKATQIIHCFINDVAKILVHRKLGQLSTLPYMAYHQQ